MSLTKITDHGLVFNHGVGVETYRVAVSIILNRAVDEESAFLYKNIIEELNNPKSCLRILIQEDKLQYSTETSEVFAQKIIFRQKTYDELAILRRKDKFNELRPSYLVFLNKIDDNHCCVGWLFRHDVNDGFKFVKSVLPLAFEKMNLIINRISINKRKSILQRVCFTLKVPYALYKLRSILPRTIPGNDVCENYYFNIESKLESIKRKACRDYNTTFNNYINATFVLAWFYAYVDKQFCCFAINLIGNTEHIIGNHTAIGIVKIKRTTDLHEIIESINKQMKSSSFKLTFIVTYQYALNYKNIPRKIKSWFNNTHGKFDFIASNIPAVDAGSVPMITGFHLSREKDDWKPNIFYGVGNDSLYTVDIYWKVSPDFNKKIFQSTLVELLSCHKFSNILPFTY